MIGRQDQLLDLIDSEGASDQCLPIEIDSSGSNNRCRIQHHSHPTISSWPAPVREEASRWIYAVKAPYFTRNRGSHNHYMLDDCDVIPILRMDRDIPSRFYVNTEYNNEENDSKSTDGGFVDVERVVLDESHYGFDKLGVRSTNPHTIKTVELLLISANIWMIQGTGSKSTTTIRPQKHITLDTRDIQPRTCLPEKLPRPRQHAHHQTARYF